MKEFILSSCVLAILLVTGCNGQPSGGDFWISGLSLPPGSVVASETEESYDLNPEPGEKYTKMRTQIIMFNNEAGWDRVVAHFDSQLGKLGFTETEYSRHKDAVFEDEFERKLIEGGRFYVKEGAGLAASLTTIDPDAAGADRMATLGQVMLTISVYE